MRFKLGFTEFVDFLDEMTNVAKKGRISAFAFLPTATYNLNRRYLINVPESIILSKVNAISLKSGVCIAGQRKCMTDRLAKGRSEGG
jgi:hypothetical protein